MPAGATGISANRSPLGQTPSSACVPRLVCSRCQHVLQEADSIRYGGEPCPECGSVSPRFEAGLTVGVSLAASGTAARSSTGREVKVLDTQRRVAYDEAQRFIHRVCGACWPPTQDELAEYDVARQAQREAEGLIRTDHRARYYRARKNLTLSQVANPKEFLALRPGSKAGRYNPGGEVYLYLAQTPHVARAEIRATDEDMVHVQAFDVDLRDQRVLVLPASADQECPALNALLFLAEEHAAPDESVYKPSQVVRLLLDELNLAAIQYPSVRAGLQGLEPGKNLLVVGPAVDVVEGQTTGPAFRCS